MSYKNYIKSTPVINSLDTKNMNIASSVLNSGKSGSTISNT